MFINGEIDESGTSHNVIYLGEGNARQRNRSADDFTLSSTSGDNYVTLGTTGGATLAGFTNTITLGSGADTLVLTAVDTTEVKMSTGSDSVKITGAVTTTGEETIYGGEGTDTLNLAADTTLTDVSFENISGFEVLVSGITTDARSVTIGSNAQSAGIRKAVGATHGDIVATAFTEAIHLVSGSGTSDISGGSKADTLVGGAGNNVITSGGGDDTMTGGGSGDADTFTIDGTTAQTVTINDLTDDKLIVTNASATVNATVAGVNGAILLMATYLLT